MSAAAPEGCLHQFNYLVTLDDTNWQAGSYQSVTAMDEFNTREETDSGCVKFSGVDRSKKPFSVTAKRLGPDQVVVVPVFDQLPGGGDHRTKNLSMAYHVTVILNGSEHSCFMEAPELLGSPSSSREMDLYKYSETRGPAGHTTFKVGLVPSFYLK